MAQETSSKKAQPPLVDNLLQYGKLAFDPSLPEATRQSNQSKFNTLIERYCLDSANYTLC